MSNKLRYCFETFAGDTGRRIMYYWLPETLDEKAAREEFQQMAEPHRADRPNEVCCLTASIGSRDSLFSEGAGLITLAVVLEVSGLKPWQTRPEELELFCIREMDGNVSTCAVYLRKTSSFDFKAYKGQNTDSELTTTSFDVPALIAQAKEGLGNVVEIYLTKLDIFREGYTYENGRNIGSVDFMYREENETHLHMATFGLYTDGTISLFCN